MAGQLHTVAEAAGILKVRESWLKTKAAARLIPCTFIGKHLRFSDDDIAEIMKAGARQPVTARERRPRARERLTVTPATTLPPQRTRDGADPAADGPGAGGPADSIGTSRHHPEGAPWRTRRSGGGARSRGG